VFLTFIWLFVCLFLKEKNQCIKEKNGITEHSKGNKTKPRSVATTHTEDGHK
jgi:DNA repair protein RadC